MSKLPIGKIISRNEPVHVNKVTSHGSEIVRAKDFVAVTSGYAVSEAVTVIR